MDEVMWLDSRMARRWRCCLGVQQLRERSAWRVLCGVTADLTPSCVQQRWTDVCGVHGCVKLQQAVVSCAPALQGAAQRYAALRSCVRWWAFDFGVLSHCVRTAVAEYQATVTFAPHLAGCGVSCAGALSWKTPLQAARAIPIQSTRGPSSRCGVVHHSPHTCRPSSVRPWRSSCDSTTSAQRQ